MRIFEVIIPFHQRAVIGVTAHQFDRFGHDIHRLRARQRDAVLRLQPKDASHSIPSFTQMFTQNVSSSSPKAGGLLVTAGVRPYTRKALSFLYSLESPFSPA